MWSEMSDLFLTSFNETLLMVAISGVVGSLLGNWLAQLVGIAPAGGLLGFVVALAGAVLLIFILQKIGVFRKDAPTELVGRERDLTPKR